MEGRNVSKATHYKIRTFVHTLLFNEHFLHLLSKVTSQAAKRDCFRRYLFDHPGEWTDSRDQHQCYYQEKAL